MSGGKAEDRANGGNAVVGTGGFGFGGDADGGPGGGEGRKGRGYGWGGECNAQLVRWGGYYSNHNLRDRA